MAQKIACADFEKQTIQIRNQILNSAQTNSSVNNSHTVNISINHSGPVYNNHTTSNMIAFYRNSFLPNVASAYNEAMMPQNGYPFFPNAAPDINQLYTTTNVNDTNTFNNESIYQGSVGHIVVRDQCNKELTNRRKSSHSTLPTRMPRTQS